MTENLKFDEINTIPALTWNWLKMNRASLEINANSDIIREKKEIVADKNETFYFPLVFENAKRYEHEQTITAKENAQITVILDYTSEENAGGFSTIKTILRAEKNSKIHLIKVQLLGKNFVQIDDTQGVCDENSQIQITQIELGGAKIFAQIKNDLSGFASKFKSDTAYICRDSQLLDLNYVVNNIAQKTDTKILVKGVVDGNAQKIYRGTIDFRNGCADSTGDEQEDTLLLSPTAVNKSIPIILCDEENVLGTHGATLGRLSAEELFYMQARGISESEAKNIMTKAKIQSVANLILHDAVRAKINDFLTQF